MISELHLLKISTSFSYDPKTGILRWRVGGIGHRVGQVAGYKSQGQIRMMFEGQRHVAHRIAWFLHHGEWPEIKIWHSNGDRTDNRISNLRSGPQPNDDLNLSQSRLKELLSYDPGTGEFTWNVTNGRCVAGTTAGTVGSSGYRQIMLGHRSYLAHRLVWLWLYGDWPKSEIDHINRCKTDNRIQNLRDASASQNACNHHSGKDITSGYAGAFWDQQRQKYRVRIQLDGQRREFRSYSDAEQAHEAYKIAVNQMHGEFSRYK